MAILSRRKFLFTTGWVAGGLTVLYGLRNRALTVAPTIIYPDKMSAVSWLQIGPDGTCSMYFPRMEMGQNANTGLAQIAAEELNLEVKDIVGVTPSTSDVAPIALTAGSMSLTVFSHPTAVAAATLRENLRARAAAKLGQPLSAILDDAGGFKTTDNETIPYADLVEATPALVEFDETQPLPALYTYDAKRKKKQVGHAAKPFDMQALVTGAPIYAGDIAMPDVLYGRAIKPPVRNARLESLDTAGVSSVPGVVKLVREDDFVGVVCKTPSAVDAAMAKIKPTWKLQQPIDQQTLDGLLDVDAHMAEGDLEHLYEDENHRPDADWAVDLRFDVQVQSHAMQEPRSAIARFRDTSPSLEIWTGTQDPWAIKRLAALDTGLSQDEVVVYPQRMGGSFGGREHYEVEMDAVRLARAVKRPVKVQWKREDEFMTSRSRPASAHRLRLATDADGNLSDWWHGYSTGHIVLARERLPGWLLPVMRLGEDMGVVRGAVTPYTVKHKRVEYNDVDLPVDLGVWRSLNAGPAVFARESAMDELALQLAKDPVDYRLQQMGEQNPRLQACLSRVRELAEKRPLPKGKGYGRGFACGIYEHRCFVAASADVYIDAQTQTIKVEHMCCVEDVGLAVNPGQLKAQMESNLAWSVGMALLERLEVGEDTIQSSNFDNYTVARMSDMPSVDMDIIDQPSIPPAGAGEVAIIAGVPAIANAVRQASGFRALRLPISYEDIKSS
ncbi:MAG: xanthine dehydrogenase family protein molybdopterin-binding subunit [Rhodobiaceae bacterium]|nr:xanthine dehydrogenase family protein molybdopterin-binding subunit [Rhodobiaceae bacterium]